MPPTTLAQPSISGFGRVGFSESVIQFFLALPEHLHNLSGNPAFMSLLYFLWALFVVLAGLIVYTAIRTMKLQTVEHENYYETFARDKEALPISRKHTEAWQEIVEHIKSDNEADWKIAILEADSLLGELVEGLGYPGDNLGEKLKAVPKGEILSLDSAWAAHKMRNRIAHEGNLKLSRRDLGETLAQFESVFREFDYI
ncbi:MAG TPA: hypothetical protein VJK09_01385 [Candidatus Paceibacterota bacterium]